MRKLFFAFLIIFCFGTCAFAGAPVRKNDLRTVFLNNQAVIMSINIRTFMASDTNKNAIVEKNKGETSGTFFSAIRGIKELSDLGVNTVHLLPITPVGKVKALGTAGSLYALTSFTELNPQLKDSSSNLDTFAQAAAFIANCHRNGIRVIIDMPSCGAYDYYLSNPGLFESDKNSQPVIPADWTDVRLFRVKNKDGSLNEELYNLHKKYVDMVMNLGANGIRADVAAIKPYEFWKKLIDYARSKDPEFLFLAEASESWGESVSKYAAFTPYDKLLDAGFDGYYGSYFNFKDFTNASQLYNLVNFNRQLSKKYNGQKSVIGSFATHDEQSPVLIGGAGYAQMIMWLNAVLPLNSYFTDGIQTGDTYIYPYANKTAPLTYTDDNTYYVHNGKIDIFNYSRMPGGTNYDLALNFRLAAAFKTNAQNFLQKADFKPLTTSNPSVFAYSRSDGRDSMIIILNKNFKMQQAAKIKVKGISNGKNICPIKITSIPVIKNGSVDVEMLPAEIQILYITEFKI